MDECREGEREYVKGKDTDRSKRKSSTSLESEVMTSLFHFPSEACHSSLV